MATKSEKPKPLTNADFPAPKKISGSDFDEICGTYNISSSHRTNTKNRLDELVTAFNEWMKKDQLQPDRASDHEKLVKAVSYVEKAANRISHLGPSGRGAARTISTRVAPLLAAQWLNESFPDDDYAPQKSVPRPTEGQRTSLRSPPRNAKYFIEEETLAARIEFVQQRPVKTTIAVLKEIIEGLKTAQRSLELQPGFKGGRKPLKYRHYLIINLAEIWKDLEFNVSPSPGSEFAGFCEAVAVSLGWPPEGMSSEIPKAVEHWRNLSPRVV